MANIRESLKSIAELDGVQCVALVDLKSGITLAIAGKDPEADIEAAAHADILKAKMQADQILGRQDKLDDILLTSTCHFILLRLVCGNGYMLYLELRRQGTNLGLVRHWLNKIESEMVI